MPVKVSDEFLLHVYCSASPDHRLQRIKTMADVGVPFPDPPPTQREMEKVTFAAKMAMVRCLQDRQCKIYSRTDRTPRTHYVTSILIGSRRVRTACGILAFQTDVSDEFDTAAGGRIEGTRVLEKATCATCLRSSK